MALWSSWLWFWGMIIFAVGMHWEGLIGIPRRTYLATSTGLGDMIARAQIPMALTGISGMVLMIASILYFTVIFRTLLGRRRVPESEEVPIPFSESLAHSEARSRPEVTGVSPAGMKIAGAVLVMDRLWIFFALALALVIVMYLPLLINLVLNTHLVPGVRLW